MIGLGSDNKAFVLEKSCFSWPTLLKQNPENIHVCILDRSSNTTEFKITYTLTQGTCMNKMLKFTNKLIYLNFFY